MVPASASGQASFGGLGERHYLEVRIGVASFGVLAEWSGGWVAPPWGRGAVRGLVRKKTVRARGTYQGG